MMEWEEYRKIYLTKESWEVLELIMLVSLLQVPCSCPRVLLLCSLLDQIMHSAPSDKKFAFEWRKQTGHKLVFSGAVMNQCMATCAHHQTDLVTMHMH